MNVLEDILKEVRCIGDLEVYMALEFAEKMETMRHNHVIFIMPTTIMDTALRVYGSDVVDDFWISKSTIPLSVIVDSLTVLGRGFRGKRVFVSHEFGDQLGVG